MPDDSTQAAILQTLAAISLLIPVAEYITARTATKLDDKIVAGIRAALALVPAIRFGSKK